MPEQYSLTADEAAAELRWLEKLLPGISADEIKKLSLGAQRITFYAGELICHQGQELDHVMLVGKGGVDVWTDSEGERVPVARHRGAFLLGELELVTGLECLTNVQAFDTTVIYCVDGSKFLQVIRGNPALCFALFEAACDRSANEIERLRLMWRPVTMQAQGRSTIALEIRRFSIKELSQDLVEMTVSPEELANCIGYGQASVTRALQKLQERGIVTKQAPGRLVVCRSVLARELESGTWEWGSPRNSD